jgi:hypothetical protein
MSNKYPRIGSIKKPNPKAHPCSGKRCVLCDKTTTGKVEVQVSYMRGDDEVEPVCGDCQKAPDLLQRIVTAWRAITPTVSAGGILGGME